MSTQKRPGARAPKVCLTMSPELEYAVSLKKLENDLNARPADVQLAHRQESRDALEPSIREHHVQLLRSRAAAVKKFVR